MKAHFNKGTIVMSQFITVKRVRYVHTDEVVFAFGCKWHKYVETFHGDVLYMNEDGVIRYNVDQREKVVVRSNKYDLDTKTVVYKVRARV